ncbi:YfiR family protein [Acinetobacter ihumii]|uniref:YfiR family protein n=1 Tax=Acinetobacter ihumii TaxID=2483802 RepID=UPI001D1947EB|nr:YfiR family protein [Acinetobacter ihumii]
MIFFVIIWVISEPVTVFAASVHNAYSMTLAILSYSKWPNNVTPTLCVIDNPTATQALQNLVKQSAYNYQVLGLTANNFPKSQCHAVFFSNISAAQQQNLINVYPNRNLLSFSSNNPECEIGSIFCLYYERGSMTFKVNLDALTHSQVHIDPRVLLLARNAE